MVNLGVVQRMACSMAVLPQPRHMQHWLRHPSEPDVMVSPRLTFFFTSMASDEFAREQTFLTPSWFGVAVCEWLLSPAGLAGLPSDSSESFAVQTLERLLADTPCTLQTLPGSFAEHYIAQVMRFCCFFSELFVSSRFSSFLFACCFCTVVHLLKVLFCHLIHCCSL